VYRDITLVSLSRVRKPGDVKSYSRSPQQTSFRSRQTSSLKIGSVYVFAASFKLYVISSTSILVSKLAVGQSAAPLQSTYKTTDVVKAVVT